MGSLPRPCSPKPCSSLSFTHKKHTGWHTKVSKKQSYRCQNKRARLVHLGTLLELWTASLFVLTGTGAFYARF